MPNALKPLNLAKAMTITMLEMMAMTAVGNSGVTIALAT